MRVLAPDGSLAERIARDPRWSQAQRDAAVKATEADPDVLVLGLDARMRPVLSAEFDGPGSRGTYALLRNGAPAKATMPMAETWRNGRST